MKKEARWSKNYANEGKCVSYFVISFLEFIDQFDLLWTGIFYPFTTSARLEAVSPVDVSGGRSEDSVSLPSVPVGWRQGMSIIKLSLDPEWGCCQALSKSHRTQRRFWICECFVVFSQHKEHLRPTSGLPVVVYSKTKTKEFIDQW
jgi:hypothetical protein